MEVLNDEYERWVSKQMVSNREISQPDPNYDGFIVIGAGLPRTGTLSLQTALTQLLKGPCYHMFLVISSKKTDPDIEHWNRALEGRLTKKDWVDFFAGRGFRAGVDYPVSKYYREIMSAFPKAKVILTKRDPIKWHHSVKETIYQIRDLGKSLLIKSVMKLLGRWQHFECVLKLSTDVFDVIESGEEESVKFFNNWTKEAKACVPKERLLEFEVKEGWGPLCKFLNLPEPDAPFPNVNDSAQMKRDFARARMLPKIFAMFGFTVIAVLVYFVF